MTDYNNFTNAELNIKLKSLENEYEAVKVKVSSLIDKMKDLDSEYLKVKGELNKRTNGEWQF